MIKNFLVSLSLLMSSWSFAQDQTAIYGTLWSEGQEFQCNWYIKKNHHVFELISHDEKNTRMRFHFKPNMDEVIVITNSTKKTVRNTIHKDSIHGSMKPLLFRKNGNKKEFESFGMCSRYQAKSTLFEGLAYSTEIDNLNLKLIEGFFKNDPVLEWFSKYNNHEFPIQYVVSKSNGELVYSYLTGYVSADFDSAIFND